MKFTVYAIPLLLSIRALGQDNSKFIRHKEIGFILGVYEMYRDSFPNRQSTDFMNYVNKTPEWVDYTYLGFSARLWLTHGIEVDARLGVDDAAVPLVANVGANYFPLAGWGLRLEAHRLTQYLNAFNAYHVQTDVEFVGDLDHNYRQIRIHERGLTLGLIKRYRTASFEIEGSAGLGFTTTKPFEVMIYQKQIGGNLLRGYKYQTHETLSVLINPKLSITYYWQTKMGKLFGVELNTNYLFTRKTIEYTRTEWLWTTDNSTAQDFSPEKHSFGKFEVGIVLKRKW